MSFEEFPYDAEAEVEGETPGGAPQPNPVRVGARERRAPQPDSDELLRRLSDVIANARPMPMSASVMIN